MYSFCDIPTYELLTGIDVPTTEEETVLALLNFHSDLAGIYMGEPCANNVEATYPDVLAGIVAYRVHRLQTVPAGIQSESVGSSSISYVPTMSQTTVLTDAETRVLDMLCGRQSSGRGLKSVSFAGAAYIATESPAQVTTRVATALDFPTKWWGWVTTNHPDWASTDRSEFFVDE